MIVEWIGQQLASVENTRMKYSGADFKFTSQANHMQKLLQMKKDYEREGFHLQRLYKRRLKNQNGIYKSTFSSIMSTSVQDNFQNPFEKRDYRGGCE
jgi:DNA topoisomerase IA